MPEFLAPLFEQKPLLGLEPPQVEEEVGKAPRLVLVLVVG